MVYDMAEEDSKFEAEVEALARYRGPMMENCNSGAEKIVENWRTIHDHYRRHYKIGVGYLDDVLHEAGRVIGGARMWHCGGDDLETIADMRDVKETWITDVSVEAMKAMKMIIIKVNRDVKQLQRKYHEGQLDCGSEAYRWTYFTRSFFAKFTTFFKEILGSSLHVNETVGCAILDVVQHVGPTLLSRIYGNAPEKLIGFLHRLPTRTVYSKVKRKGAKCLVTMIKLRDIQEDPQLMKSIFHTIEENLGNWDSRVNSEFGQAFAVWTELLPIIWNEYKLKYQEFQSEDFAARILNLALRCASLSDKSKQSFCKVAGYIYKTIDWQINRKAIRDLLKRITEELCRLLSWHSNYELRCASASSLRYAMGPPIYRRAGFPAFQLEMDELIVKSLGNWIPQSDNYDERVLLIKALKNMKYREGYGAQHAYIWKVMGLSSRFPAKSGDLMNFKIQSLRLGIHLITEMEEDYIDKIECEDSAETFEELARSCKKRLSSEVIREVMACMSYVEHLLFKLISKGDEGRIRMYYVDDLQNALKML